MTKELIENFARNVDSNNETYYFEFRSTLSCEDSYVEFYSEELYDVDKFRNTSLAKGNFTCNSWRKFGR